MFNLLIIYFYIVYIKPDIDWRKDTDTYKINSNVMLNA